MSARHIMIDLETLGQRPGCAIVEIAARVFDLETGRMGGSFHAYVQPVVGSIDPGTVDWHRKQGTYPQAREAVALLPFAALPEFAAWYAEQGEIAAVWAWGASFDFPVLGAIWALVFGPKQALPWKYYQGQCARTVWNLAFPGVKRPDRPHLAMADVEAAIRDVSRAWRRISWPLWRRVWWWIRNLF